MTKMYNKTVVVFGGSGFIGSHLVARLSALGARVLVPTRRYESAKHLIFLPRVEVLELPALDQGAMARLLDGADVAINLVGILHSNPGTPYGSNFAHAHVELPRRIVAACAAQGVPRYLHMSALGAAAEGPSMYLRSKADGEAAARSEASVAVTIMRPSVVFGPQDKFLNMFARLQRFSPVVPLACADVDFQPVYVGDVAQAFINAIGSPATRHQVYELGGPFIYTLADLVRLAGRYSGHPRPILEMPRWFGRLQARLLELLPGEPLMSRDNVDSMLVDNVIDPTLQEITARALNIQFTPLETVAPHYLAPKLRYDEFRTRAGR
jgi:uncharacterized protein YbjT (DUF2867 family)